MHSEYGIIDEKTALKINQCKKKGGKIIAEGTPEKVSQVEKSYTGRFIRELLGDSNMKKTA